MSKSTEKGYSEMASTGSQMINVMLKEKQDAGNPRVRFEEGEVASGKPRRMSLLYGNKTIFRIVVILFALTIFGVVTYGAEKRLGGSVFAKRRVGSPVQRTTKSKSKPTKQKAEFEKQETEFEKQKDEFKKKKAEFEKDLAKISTVRKCFKDGCEITANYWLRISVLKRKSGGFNYVVGGNCNGVANTRLYYKDCLGWTKTEDVDWSYDFSYLMLSDEAEWANWMDALKAVHAKVIEWVDVATKNNIDKVEKEIPIGIEVHAHNNMITKGKGQRELYMSAVREWERSDTPVKFFCTMSRYDNEKYSGGVVARCGCFEQGILRFGGDKTDINNDILLLIERYNPEALKKAYLEHAKKQDLLK